MSYRIKLENFEGPLDLLLYFIRRDELDIYDIPISKITKDKKGVRWDFSFMGNDAAKLQAVAEAKGITS